MLKGKELHVLKPLNYERFRVAFSEQNPLFDFIVAHEGIETNFRVWSLARKLKILGRLRLFRIVVNVIRPKFRTAVSAGDLIHFRAVCHLGLNFSCFSCTPNLNFAHDFLGAAPKSMRGLTCQIVISCPFLVRWTATLPRPFSQLFERLKHFLCVRFAQAECRERSQARL